MAHLFHSDSLSCFVGLFIVFFSALTILYSVGFMSRKKGLLSYYLYIISTLVVSLGAVFTKSLIAFIVFWGLLGFLLYMLVGFGEKERTPSTAKKAFIIIGGTDALMLFGIALIWKMCGSFDMTAISISLASKPAIVAYLCLAIGAFAKAGAMPFHTWVPDVAEDAPTPVTAFLPASLDKLLGIYFLVRISLSMFVMTTAMNTFLMAIGSISIVVAVMMALVQHDFKRLLGYHAVSQVGYMVLGIGTGNPVGIAGGLFHMVNNAIYKSCLFFSSGAVEKKTGTTDLDNLGGLAKSMPIVFIAFLIASFAISGIPPLNGFVSKWMIYQGIIETAKNGGHLWIAWLIAAMFGSALTLASFMKLVHAVFLGQPSVQIQKTDLSKHDIGAAMRIPLIVLATLCVLFGVFAIAFPLKHYIFPSLPFSVHPGGVWNAGLATVLIIVGIFIGVIIFSFSTVAKMRESDIFIGGENPEKYPEMRLSGTDFYTTIQDLGFLKVMYVLAQKKVFDIYEVGTKIVFGLNRIVKFLHNGVLPTYLSWCLLGAGILFYMLLLR